MELDGDFGNKVFGTLAALSDHNVEGGEHGDFLEADRVWRGWIRRAEELAEDGLRESADVSRVRPVGEACQHFEAVQKFSLERCGYGFKRDDIEVLFLLKDGDEAPPAFLAADPILFTATIPCFFGAIDSYLSSLFGFTLLALFPCALANLSFPQRFCGLGCLNITSQRDRVIQPGPCKSRDFFLFSLCLACLIMPFPYHFYLAEACTRQSIKLPATRRRTLTIILLFRRRKQRLPLTTVSEQEQDQSES